MRSRAIAGLAWSLAAFSIAGAPASALRSSAPMRAAELGGTCTVARASGGGTRVHALIPVPAG